MKQVFLCLLTDEETEALSGTPTGPRPKNRHSEHRPRTYRRKESNPIASHHHTQVVQSVELIQKI